LGIVDSFLHPSGKVSTESGQLQLELVRGHGSIKNCSHGVRDVTSDEDRCQVRTAQGPRMMAILRNLAIAIIRLLGFDSIPTEPRTFAQRPRLALNALSL